MPFQHILLAITVVIIWGMNFISVSLALTEITPFWLCAIRFFLAAIPGIFFFKPPAMSIRLLALYGFITFALQFSFMFIGMSSGMPPGLASLLLQVQVFFSMFFSSVLLGEKPDRWQILGAVVSFSGIALVARHFDVHVTVSGFLFILAAAASWGLGNLVTKKTGKINAMSLVVWGSLFALVPITLMAMILEGPHRLMYSLHHVTKKGIFSTLYIVYASTCAGYGVWNWLISRHPVSAVVPFALLVPIVAIVGSNIILGEIFYTWKIMAGILVIAGLVINLGGSRYFMQKKYEERHAA